MSGPAHFAASEPHRKSVAADALSAEAQDFTREIAADLGALELPPADHARTVRPLLSACVALFPRLYIAFDAVSPSSAHQHVKASWGLRFLLYSWVEFGVNIS